MSEVIADGSVISGLHLRSRRSVLLALGITRVALIVRFGSLAPLLVIISLMSALERKAVVREWSFGGVILNVPFSRKRTFKHRENH